MTLRRLSIPALAAFLIAAPFVALAQQTPADLQQQIDQHNQQIQQLNQEIAQYQTQLDATSKKAKTLQNARASLNLQIKKVQTSITLTQNQIAATQLEIQQLGKGIESKQSSIQVDQSGLAQSLRSLDAAEKQPLVVQVLGAEDAITAWQDLDAYDTIQGAVSDRIDTLSKEKQSLTATKTSREQKQAQLQKQQASLASQQGSLTAAKAAQNDLLAQTKNQEANYQAIISQKRSQEASLEAALSDLKSKYNVAIKPDQITPAGKGVLSWPVDHVVITQYFGNTPFAASGAYNGKGHNGIDLGVPIGTPIRAALSGVVIGSGNTDSVRGCYSFGKWVMVRHNNGLNTMYAHLSSIQVSEGQSVSTGQLLGYSGQTGYATGPHLHFGVYVSASTQIVQLGAATQASTPCARATMPVTPLAGYLNPLNYLP